MMKPQLNALEEKFYRHCLEENFFSPGDRILLAVSGGMDSMVLCHLMNGLKDHLKIEFAIAHINHSLRGKASDKDATFVKKYAANNTQLCFLKKVDVAGEAARTKMSIEEAARNLRYTYLKKIAKRYGYNKICTAHHLGDQAETILMRIIKGTGWSGLTGIRVKRELFIRPLLIFSRDEIESYLKEKKIRYVEDRSNRDKTFFRNRVRHELIPLLKKRFDPQIEKHLVQLGLIAEETKTFISHDAQKHFSSVCSASNGKIVLEIKAFNRYLRAQKHALIEMIFTVFFDLTPHYSDYQHLFNLIEKRQSGKKILIGNVKCARTSSRVIFEIARKTKRIQFYYDIHVGRSYRFDDEGWTFSSKALTYSTLLKKQFGRSRDTEFIDAEKISGTLSLRNWKAGDKFVPLGMSKFKRLSDFFIDEKVPLDEKRLIPILTERANGHESIIWICGLRIDNRYKIDNSTHHILKMKCERHEKDP